MENKGIHAVPAQEIPFVAGQEEKQGPAFKQRTFEPPTSKIDPPLSIYQEIKGEPYTIKYFGLTDWLFFMKNPVLDASGLKEKVDKVENFAKREIERLHLQDSTESYIYIMNKMRDQLKVPSLERPEVTFQKILKYIGRIRGKSAYSK